MKIFHRLFSTKKEMPDVSTPSCSSKSQKYKSKITPMERATTKISHKPKKHSNLTSNPYIDSTSSDSLCQFITNLPRAKPERKKKLWSKDFSSTTIAKSAKSKKTGEKKPESRKRKSAGKTQLSKNGK